MRRRWVAVIALALCCAATPAHADTRTRDDAAADEAGLPAAYDLTRATWDYRPERLLVTAEMADVQRDGVVVTARSAHDWEGYEVVARTWWQDGRKKRRLWIWFNTVERTPVACPEMRARWRTGSVRLSVPSSCLFDGATMRDFSVTTTAVGSAVVMDQISSPRRLDSKES